jgi:predicted ester cyclase
MTTEQSKEFVLKYLEAVHGKPKPMELLDQYISDTDAELKGHILVFEAGLPCYDFIVEDMIAEGNKVVVRFTAKGQHTGDLFGCAPTGNHVKIPGIIIYELADNMIVNHWMEVDSVGLMQQISTPVLA